MSLERNSKLINRKFITYLIPSILMIFAMQFGSLVDGILIGNMISNEALSASSLVVPILYVVQMPGFALGIGGSIVVANQLGKRDVEGAKRTFSFTMVVGMGLSLLFALLSFFVSRPLASLFGEASIEYSYPYVYMFLLTDPVITFALLIGSFMAVDNNPRLSSLFYIVSNAAKVGLEILFIAVFKMGMWGAALSTGAGYFVGLIVTIFYFVSKKRLLSFTFKLKGCMIKDVSKASATSAINLLLTAVQMLIINIFIGKLLSDFDLVIFGLISNMVFLFDLLCGGVLNIIPTLCGIFYGEKDYYSLRSIARKIYVVNIVITVLISLFILIFPNVYCAIFGFNNSDNPSYVNNLLWVYLISFLPYEINKFSMNYYPTVDKSVASIVTVLLRELIIVLPLTLVLLHTNGLMGYSLASALNEVVTVIITYIFIYFYNRKKGYRGLFMLEKLDVESFDVSLKNDEANASKVSEQIVEFAKKHNIPERESQIIGLAAEEMVDNIIVYGYKKEKSSYIDVNLKLYEDNLLLRIRDDGVPFDPTKYEENEEEEYSTSGIKLIKNLTDKMTYMRILNLNNTIFEIKLNGGISNGN
ncbi:MAG: hypothetical protein E7178_03290 [Erysipelotrichaceae bacterium]|nr:hypothetical protein [Erysipelotrichaceae bacterium]